MKAAAGTTPRGTANEQEASAWVREMFTVVAPRYDLLNHLLSFNIDRLWRRALLERLTPVLRRPGARVLDLCCGTGDVLLELQRRSTPPVYGADFCHPMLVSAAAKARRRSFTPPLFEADALELPVSENTFDGIAIAFGFRNLANYCAGLKELFRVLKAGGVLAILEFSHPQGGVLSRAYHLYSRLLPLIGAFVSKSRDAYTYLPDSIEKFPSAEDLERMMNEAGFVSTSFKLLTGGIAALHSGVKP